MNPLQAHTRVSPLSFFRILIYWDALQQDCKLFGLKLVVSTVYEMKSKKKKKSMKRWKWSSGLAIDEEGKISRNYYRPCKRSICTTAYIVYQRTNKSQYQFTHVFFLLSLAVAFLIKNFLHSSSITCVLCVCVHVCIVHLCVMFTNLFMSKAIYCNEKPMLNDHFFVVVFFLFCLWDGFIYGRAHTRYSNNAFFPQSIQHTMRT